MSAPPPKTMTQAVFQWQWKTMAGPKTLAGLTEDPEYAAPASMAQAQNPSRARRRPKSVMISDQVACGLLCLEVGNM